MAGHMQTTSNPPINATWATVPRRVCIGLPIVDRIDTATPRGWLDPGLTGGIIGVERRSPHAMASGPATKPPAVTRTPPSFARRDAPRAATGGFHRSGGPYCGPVKRKYPTGRHTDVESLSEDLIARASETLALVSIIDQPHDRVGEFIGRSRRH